MKIINREKISKLVKTKREEKNYSQQELSELTGINRAMLSKIETGVYLPLLPQLEKLGEILDFEYEDFELVDYKCHPRIKGEVAV